MKIACLQFNPIQENTYVVWDDTKACIVIDAGNSNPARGRRAGQLHRRARAETRHAVNTHGHFDHTLGVEHLKQRYGIPSPSRRRTGSCWTTQRRAVRSSA